MNETAATAAAAAILVALSAVFHWGLRKVFPQMTWRRSIGVMLVTLFGLSFTIALWPR